MNDDLFRLYIYLLKGFVSLCAFGLVLLLTGFILYMAMQDPDRWTPQHVKDRSRSRPLDFGLHPIPENVMAVVRSEKTAWRLYDEVESRYPRQSRDWIWEKVRWDVIRDRH